MLAIVLDWKVPIDEDLDGVNDYYVYDFNYTIFGSKEKTDAVKEAIKTATAVVDYAGQAKDIAGMPKFMNDNISTGASLLGNAENGYGWGAASDVRGC